MEGNELPPKRRHTLKKIQWPEIVSGQEFVSDPVFTDKYSLDEAAAGLKADKDVKALLEDGLQMLRQVLSVPNFGDYKVGNDMPGSLAFLRLEADGHPILEMSDQMLKFITESESQILRGKRDPEELVEVGEDKNEEIKFKTWAGAGVALALQSLAHEMYHVRQVFQDMKYYKQTEAENRYARAILEEAKENPALKRIALGIYHRSEGEHAAEGFSIRFVKEYKKRLLAKKADELSVAEKLYICGVDELVKTVFEDIKLRLAGEY